jgi:hypothetical protein
MAAAFAGHLWRVPRRAHAGRYRARCRAVVAVFLSSQKNFNNDTGGTFGA